MRIRNPIRNAASPLSKRVSPRFGARGLPSPERTARRPAPLAIPCNDAPGGVKRSIPVGLDDRTAAQGYDQARYRDPKSGLDYRIERTPLTPDTSRFTLRSAEGRRLTERTVPHDALETVVIAGNLHPSFDLDGDGIPCLSHEDLVLAYARRRNPFAHYQLIDHHPQKHPDERIRQTYVSYDADLLHGISGLIAQGTRVDRLNMSYGHLIHLDELEPLLRNGRLTPGTLERNLGFIRQAVQRLGADDGNTATTLEDAVYRHVQSLSQTRKPPRIKPDDRTAVTRLAQCVADMFTHLHTLNRLSRQGVEIYAASGNNGRNEVSSVLLADIHMVRATDRNGHVTGFSGSRPARGRDAQGVYRIVRQPVGLNLTEVPGAIDVPAQNFSSHRLQLQISRYAGQPWNAVCLTRAETSRLLAEASEAVAGRERRASPAQAGNRDALLAAFLASKAAAPYRHKLVPARVWFEELRVAVGLQPEFYSPNQWIPAESPPGGAALRFIMDKNDRMQLLRTIPAVLSGTSFASPTLMGQDSLTRFFQQVFGPAPRARRPNRLPKAH